MASSSGIPWLTEKSCTFLEHQTGMRHHKAAGINWLRGHGVRIDTDHLVIASGTLNTLTLVLLAFFELGNRIAVDRYTFANLIEIAKMLHLKLVPIPGDQEGMIAGD